MFLRWPSIQHQFAEQWSNNDRYFSNQTTLSAHQQNGGERVRAARRRLQPPIRANDAPDVWDVDRGRRLLAGRWVSPPLPMTAPALAPAIVADDEATPGSGRWTAVVCLVDSAVADAGPHTFPTARACPRHCPRRLFSNQCPSLQARPSSRTMRDALPPHHPLQRP